MAGYTLNVDDVELTEALNPYLAGLRGKDRLPHALATIGTNKATGPDKCQGKWIKPQRLALPILHQSLESLQGCRDPFATRRFQEARLVKLAKRDTWRPISVLNTQRKLFEKVLLNLISLWDYQSPKFQRGGTQGQDMGTATVEVIAALNSNRSVLFLDVKSAYDTVDRLTVADFLVRKGTLFDDHRDRHIGSPPVHPLAG